MCRRLVTDCKFHIWHQVVWAAMLITRFTKVPEPAEDEGKLSYTNFKWVVWHEAFLHILDKLKEFSKTGYCHKCYDEII